MYLANRRCAIVATVLTMYFLEGKTPSKSMLLSTALILAGAFVAGWENFASDGFGVLVVWVCNFTQAGANCTLAGYNKDKLLSNFELTFFFYFVGLLFVCPYVYFTGMADNAFDLLQ